MIALPDMPWLGDALVVLAVVAGLHLLVVAVLGKMAALAGRSAMVWDDAVVRAARRPLQTMLWVLGLAIVGGIAARQVAHPLFEYVDPARKIGIIVCLAWFLLGLIHCVADNVVRLRLAKGEEVDRTTVDALSKLGRVSVLIVGMLVILQTLGFSISGVLAFGGIGGIAVGFAAKDLLANFFGGLTIYLDRPFAVGEWIRSPDKQIEGSVEYISWRHTRIRGFNKNPIYVPNAVFTNIVVENPSRMSHRRIRENIGLRYQDLGKLPAIVGAIGELLRTHPEIDTSQTTIVNFNEFADSSLNILLQAYTRTTSAVEFHAFKQDLLLQVAAIIAGHGAEIAFPTRRLHIATEPAQNALPAAGQAEPG